MVNIHMHERQQLILDRLEEQGTCSYEELTKRFNVSIMTVRRDVEELARQGAVIKTVGGILKAQAVSSLYETALLSRLSANRREKRTIAKCALDLVKPQTTLYVDGSTTCLELAKLLAQEKQGLTIVTNSALVCLELGRSAENTVIGIGGQYDANSFSHVGPQTEEWAKTLFVDLAFISTKGFLPSSGTFESSLPTFRITRIIAQQCVELVLLVDHSKFGQRALSKVLDISQIHTVVTDEKTSKADLQILRNMGKTVWVAPVENPRTRSAMSAEIMKGRA